MALENTLCHHMLQVRVGDTMHMGRYLSGGALEEGSLYLEVEQVGGLLS